MKGKPLKRKNQIPRIPNITTLKNANKKKKPGILNEYRVFLFWRSRRDLNPRYPFGVHTISSRARYDHFDTAP